MLVKLQIIFTILSAICVAAIFPVGTYLDWLGALGCGIAAFLFFGGTLLCKSIREKKENPPSANQPQGDYFNPVNEQKDEKED